MDIKTRPMEQVMQSSICLTDRPIQELTLLPCFPRNLLQPSSMLKTSLVDPMYIILVNYHLWRILPEK
ncbi:MAG: hypothetical protein ACTS73_01760 [Arsenophonus sp. NEOnobi-MAG3]